MRSGWRGLAGFWHTNDAGRHAAHGLNIACANVPVWFETTTGKQPCITCMKYDRAMISKASSLCDGIHSGQVGLNLFGLRLAAHSSLQEVSEPWQLAAMLFQSSLLLECERAFLATEGRGIGLAGGEKAGFKSAVRLCYETATDGVWRMHIDCARILIVCKNNDYYSIAVSPSFCSLSACVCSALISHASHAFAHLRALASLFQHCS